MEKLLNVYCRFCAEPKYAEKTINFFQDTEKHEDILSKLNFLHAIYVDISSNDNSLPKTMCFVCYDSLNKAYDFLSKAKEAQVILENIIPTEKNEKIDFSDDDLTGFDDFLENPETDTSVIKEENSKVELHVSSNVDNKSLEVKKEPKDEFLEVTPLEATPNGQTLDVEYLLDSAVCNVLYDGIPVYLNENSDVEKRSITKWQEYPWICSHCNIEFLDVTTLRLHSKLTHEKCNAFVCIDCKNFGYCDFGMFLSHVRKHRRILRKRCHYCDESVDEALLSSHVQEHFKRNQVPCNLCGDIFKNDESLQKHLDEFNQMKPKRKPRRKRGTPLTVADLTCTLCKKVYKNPNSLRDHMKIHMNDRKRNYTCDRCGKMFYNKGTLTSHIMAHDKIRPHTCRICNKSFLFPNMLRRHVEMHTGIKPFSCEQCGKCFRLQYQLNAHKIIHTDSMPHVCSYCNKAFRFKQILKNHERQHTGAKPYACLKCGMEFTNWSNYNKHMKRRHDVDTSKKKITPDGVFPINPNTGELVQLNDAATEEWKTKIMVPAKRGKKKSIKKGEV